jgi:hypothetical protein
LSNDGLSIQVENPNLITPIMGESHLDGDPLVKRNEERSASSFVVVLPSVEPNPGHVALHKVQGEHLSQVNYVAICRNDVPTIKSGTTGVIYKQGHTHGVLIIYLGEINISKVVGVQLGLGVKQNEVIVAISDWADIVRDEVSSYKR